MEDRIVAAATTDDCNEDDWHSVKDAKKRKQIQDRLAQRARRMNIPLFLKFL
jgi:alkylhydroperoxidase family enzyme